MTNRTEDQQAQPIDGATADGKEATTMEAPEAMDAQEAAPAGADVQSLRAEAAALQDKLLRQAAEYQNYRRRTEQERIGLIDSGKMMVLKPMLDVLDDFSRSLEAAQQADGQENPDAAFLALRQGVELVYRKFNDVLTSLGVEPIEAVGEPFDENMHEALMQQPAAEGTASGVVLNEFQKGYRLGDRVLRHSKVVVSG